MSCTPEKQFPGAWPESPLHSSTSSVMDCHQTFPLGDSLEESQGPSSSSCPAVHHVKKPAPLRIIVPPTEYCPFSTDLTLPITPLSLPTAVSSSCFTFNDTQEFASQNVVLPPASFPVLSRSKYLHDTDVTELASPTSSQFLLMPPTPCLKVTKSEAATCVSPLSTPAGVNEPTRARTKLENPRPWQISPSTWLSDLGGHTETDHIFRCNLLDLALADMDSSSASTPALSLSAVSPSPQVTSSLVPSSPTPLVKSPASPPPTPSPYSCAMPPKSHSPARLALKPTGTETFPSTLDSLQAWRESVMPGTPGCEEPPSPLSDVIHILRSEELVQEATVYASLPHRQLHRHHITPQVPRISRSKTLMKQAKTFGERVKQLVTRQNTNKHRSSMDRDVRFRAITSQDSEDGSVILITAPPYEVRPLAHSTSRQEHMRSRTNSEYSSVDQVNLVEQYDVTESGYRHGNRNRNALRRLSLAALSTIKRL